MSNQQLFDFPYNSFKSHLVDCFASRLRDFGLENRTEDLIDLHIGDDMQAMPIITHDVQKGLLEALRSGEPMAKIKSKIPLEDASTWKGMFRVLVRTRMNSSGINNVSRGNSNGDKTLSPRILNFIETVDLGHQYTPEELVSEWLIYAQSIGANAEAGARYEDKDIAALARLAYALDQKRCDEDIRLRLSPYKLNEYFNSGKEINGFYGWVAIVATVVTGLWFLQENRWRIYAQATQNPRLDYDHVNALINDVKRRVLGFQYALAGSYLADMGGVRFVKDDTHVRAFAVTCDPGLRDAKGRVEFVFTQAENCGVSPRTLDKLLYMAGSGHMPLIGLKVKDGARIKKEMLCRLV
jgi:hypothetical protein